MKNGTLYGVGVGPGDPDLITLKAAKILKQVDVIFAAASTKNSYSLAMEIASPHLKEGAPVVSLGFPMTRDKKKLADAWEKNGRKVVESLKKGGNAAFITLGDPLIYSTFGYIFHTIKETEPDIPIEIIPGITSYQAGAAAVGQILVEAEESFAVVSGALGAERLKDVVHNTDRVILLKVYHQYREIMDTLNQLGLASGSILISRCGLDDEVILRDLKEGFDTPPPYLSLLLIKKIDPV
ncbi:MAG: precorrin-2 C(20)-methyltransferase [Deltaproteobacteria bacterium]|nr:precorrin-2 C(20)-methyltransferase [Deltaproteobacteria bacterium]